MSESDQTPLKGIAQWLARPYPLWRGAAREAVVVLAATAFGALVVLATRPFGLWLLEGAEFIPLVLVASAICGVVALAFRVAAPMALERFGAEASWNVGRQLLLEASEIIVLAGGLLALMTSAGHSGFDAWTVLTFVAVTALCATPVLIVRLLLVERRLRRTHEQLAESMQAPTAASDVITITGRDETLRLEPGALRYIRAEENYVEVAWLDGRGELNRRLMRMTLRDISAALAAHGVVQCHRSYLVLLSAVSKVQGNAQGYRLVLDKVPDPVPVSRSKAAEIFAALKAQRDLTVRASEVHQAAAPPPAL